MNLPDNFHHFRIEENIHAGAQPPYYPQNYRSYALTGEELQQRAGICRELMNNFQVFIDLREPGETGFEYSEALPENCFYERFSIRDVSVPPDMEFMQMIVDRIIFHADAGRRVYIHCFGGRGRTGTVGACLLAYRQGLTGEEALIRWMELFSASMKGRRGDYSPETFQQEQFVRKYAKWLQTRKINNQKE